MFKKIKKRREKRIEQKSDKLKRMLCERTQELGACPNNCKEQGSMCYWYVEKEDERRN